jgi:hypothetical protein
MAWEMAGAIHEAGLPSPGQRPIQHSWEVNSLEAKGLHFFVGSQCWQREDKRGRLGLGMA